MDDELLQRLGAPTCKTCGSVISKERASIQSFLGVIDAVALSAGVNFWEALRGTDETKAILKKLPDLVHCDKCATKLPNS